MENKKTRSDVGRITKNAICSPVLAWCWPASTTLTQHQASIGLASCILWDAWRLRQIFSQACLPHHSSIDRSPMAMNIRDGEIHGAATCTCCHGNKLAKATLYFMGCFIFSDKWCDLAANYIMNSHVNMVDLWRRICFLLLYNMADD